MQTLAGADTSGGRCLYELGLPALGFTTGLICICLRTESLSCGAPGGEAAAEFQKISTIEALF